MKKIIITTVLLVLSLNTFAKSECKNLSACINTASKLTGKKYIDGKSLKEYQYFI